MNAFLDLVNQIAALKPSEESRVEHVMRHARAPSRGLSLRFPPPLALAVTLFPLAGVTNRGSLALVRHVRPACSFQYLRKWASARPVAGDHFCGTSVAACPGDGTQ